MLKATGKQNAGMELERVEESELILIYTFNSRAVHGED